MATGGRITFRPENTTAPSALATAVVAALPVAAAQRHVWRAGYVYIPHPHLTVKPAARRAIIGTHILANYICESCR